MYNICIQNLIRDIIIVYYNILLTSHYNNNNNATKYKQVSIFYYFNFK
jgi:hypothetical protein